MENILNSLNSIEPLWLVGAAAFLLIASAFALQRWLKSRSIRQPVSWDTGWDWGASSAPDRSEGV